MIKPIITLNVYYSGVTIERSGVKINKYRDVSKASLARLHRAVSNVMNKYITPRITLFSGGYEIEF